MNPAISRNRWNLSEIHQHLRGSWVPASRSKSTGSFAIMKSNRIRHISSFHSIETLLITRNTEIRLSIAADRSVRLPARSERRERRRVRPRAANNVSRANERTAYPLTQVFQTGSRSDGTNREEKSGRGRRRKGRGAGDGGTRHACRTPAPTPQCPLSFPTPVIWTKEYPFILLTGEDASFLFHPLYAAAIRSFSDARTGGWVWNDPSPECSCCDDRRNDRVSLGARWRKKFRGRRIFLARSCGTNGSKGRSR